MHQEFRRLNSLENERWPKLSWPNFLDISGKSKELLTFVELYLKSFELAREAPDGPIFDYHRMFNNHDIDALLEFGDYSTAESIATGTNPFPKRPFMEQWISLHNQAPPDSYKSSILLDAVLLWQASRKYD